MSRPRPTALLSTSKLTIAVTVAAVLILALLGVGGAMFLAADETSSDPDREHLREKALQEQAEWLDVRAAGPQIREVDPLLQAELDGLIAERVVAEPSVLQAAREAEEPAPEVAQTTTTATTESSGGVYQQGTASWYGPGFAGNTTANGETYDPSALTAAHPSLPFNTMVRVTNQNTGQSVTVRINDRGPYAGGRIIDLSEAAAETIGMRGSGLAPVTLELTG